MPITAVSVSIAGGAGASDDLTVEQATYGRLALEMKPLARTDTNSYH